MELYLNRLRAILAILLALALTLAPIGSVWAAMQMRAGTDEVALASHAGDAKLSDCMKAMRAQGQAQGQAQDQSCPCCDTPLKGACPDMGACLAKCSAQVIAVLAPGADNHLRVHRHDRPADPEKPPDRAFPPPAPPPRA